MNEAEGRPAGLTSCGSMSEALKHQRGGQNLVQRHKEQTHVTQTASSQIGGPRPCEMAHASCHALHYGLTECFEF